MLFCLSRLELPLVVRSDSQRDAPIRGGDATNTPTPAALPIPTVRIAGQEGISYTPDGLCAHIDDQYLRHYDEKIPLCFFTLTMDKAGALKDADTGVFVRLNQGSLAPLGDGTAAPSGTLSTTRRGRRCSAR